MTVTSAARVGYLNAILAQGGGNLNKSIFDSSNARGIARGMGGGGMLMFRIDWRIRDIERFLIPRHLVTFLLRALINQMYNSLD